jgi:hypothetical protein
MRVVEEGTQAALNALVRADRTADEVPLGAAAQGSHRAAGCDRGHATTLAVAILGSFALTDALM